MSDPNQRLRVVPTPDDLRLWADELIPGESDIWYWDDSPLDPPPTGCQVMTREAYRADPAYRDIRYANAYCEWLMPAAATQVIVSDAAWIGTLSAVDRHHVLQKQIELKCGLVFPAEWFGEQQEQLQPQTLADRVVLGQAAWASLPTGIQQRALLAEQRWCDNVECYPIPDGTPPHVRAIANTFSPHEGTNCFAITAYGATADPHLLATWLTVSPIDIVAPLGYREVPDREPMADDIVIFELGDRIIHAAWCLGHDRFLNKNAQSRFAPVRIVDWTMLDADWLAEWPDTTWTIYRRGTP